MVIADLKRLMRRMQENGIERTIEQTRKLVRAYRDEQQFPETTGDYIRKFANADEYWQITPFINFIEGKGL